MNELNTRNNNGWLNFFSDLFPEPFMKTDIREKDGHHYLDIEVPGFKKEELKLTLRNGTLTISAHHESNTEEKDDKGNVLRQERHSGSAMRSWYIGEDVEEKDIRASFHDGLLTVDIPDTLPKENDTQKQISIE